MGLYINTNIAESRGLLALQRSQNTISTILERLATGYRINSAKDDPTGLIIRDGLRSEMKVMQSAISNTGSAINLLSIADSAMSSVAELLNGKPDDPKSTGLIGLINDASATPEMKRQGVQQILDSLDTLSRSTTYNGKRIIGGGYGYTVVSTGANRNNISNIQVSRATVNGSTPLNFSFTVNTVAQKAGIQLENGGINVTANDATVLVFADGNGRSVQIELTNETGVVKNYSTSDVLDQLKTALENNPSVAIKAYLDTSDNLLIESPIKGAKQAVTLTMSDNTGTPNYSPVFSDAYGTAVWDQIKGILATEGADWGITGFSGNVVTNDNYVSIYSNDVTLKANLEKAIAGNKLNLQIAGGTAFQLGKSVNSANTYYLGIPNVNSETLGGPSGRLADLRTLSFETDADVQTALQIVNESITNLAVQRGGLGVAQQTFSLNKTNLEDQLTVVSQAESEISNTDVALESSRLTREELLAQAAVNSIMYSREFLQFAVNAFY
ncbi:MAG: flagellin [Thermoguttaceae bacterium]